MIMGIRNTICSKYKVSIGTHSGIFHSDDVVAIAILDIAFDAKEILIVRSRDEIELSQTTLNVDIGGGKFDHHMKGFNQKRPTGEIYASAGLIWKEYAKEAIKNIRIANNLNYMIFSEEELNSIIDTIDRDLIIPVDLEDNGIAVSPHTFSFISSFLPSWTETANYNAAFEKVEILVCQILKAKIKEEIIKIISQKVIRDKLAVASLKSSEILELPAQTFPWKTDIINFNKENNNQIKFVIFPYTTSCWAAQSVPPSLEEEFKQLVPFPKSWAGLTFDDLAKVSKVHDALFCHNNLFFVRADTKESVIKMCQIAIDTYKK